MTKERNIEIVVTVFQKLNNKSFFNKKIRLIQALKIIVVAVMALEIENKFCT